MRNFITVDTSRVPPPCWPFQPSSDDMGLSQRVAVQFIRGLTPIQRMFKAVPGRQPHPPPASSSLEFEPFLGRVSVPARSRLQRRRKMLLMQRILWAETLPAQPMSCFLVRLLEHVGPSPLAAVPCIDLFQD